MVFVKHPNNFSVEELLKQAESSQVENDVTTEPSNDVIDFISFYNLKPGIHTVRRTAIHNLYNKWSKKRVSTQIFGVIMNSYFKNSYHSYYINLNVIDITKAALKLVSKRKPDKTKSPTYQKHVDSFLSHYDLKPGKTLVELEVLYYLYDKWTYKNHNRKPLAQKTLSQFLDIHFEYVSRSKYGYKRIYKLKDITKIISKEEIEEIKKAVHAKEAKQAQQKQISRTRAKSKSKN